MFLWSNKRKKSVTFSEDVADETLLAAVENELDKQPYKSFSDLCKEALWQFLYVPESVRPSPKSGQVEQQIAELQGQLMSLEQRVAARDSSRLDALEGQVNQLAFQIGQLAIAVNQLPRQAYAPTPAVSGPMHTSLPVAHSEPELQPETLAPPQEVDPLLSRLGSLLDDF